MLYFNPIQNREKAKKHRKRKNSKKREKMKHKKREGIFMSKYKKLTRKRDRDSKNE